MHRWFLLTCLLAACTPEAGEQPPGTEPPTGLVEHLRTSVGLNPEQAATGDLDRNGHLDVVVANHGTNDLTLMFNNGDGSFTVLEQPGDFEGPCGVRVRDVNQDGSPDVLVSSDLGNYATVLMNNGAGGLVEESTVAAGLDLCDFELPHLNGDEYPDLVLASADDDELTFHLNSGALGGWEAAGEFGDPQAQLELNRPNTVIFPDVDGDGFDDLVAAEEDGGGIAVVLSRGGSIFPDFPPTLRYETGHEPEDVRAGDLDGDGDLDLVVGNYATNDFVVLRNDGDGFFDEAEKHDSGIGTGRVALGDIDGDGDLDVAAANYQDGTVVLFVNDGDGDFERDQELASGLGPGYLEFADFDGDGVEELLSVNFVSSDVVIYRIASGD